MKKLSLYFMITVFSFSIFPMEAMAIEKKASTVASNPKEVPAEVKVLLNRLEEIKAIDKSELKSSERKVLRKEVRAINAELRSTGNGVYLSIGAIIIIVLLLILLL